MVSTNLCFILKTYLNVLPSESDKNIPGNYLYYLIRLFFLQYVIDNVYNVLKREFGFFNFRISSSNS